MQQRRQIFVREWRKFRGLTLEKLAERLHVHKGTLSRLERGDQRYTQDFLEAAASELNCDVVDLLIRNPLDPESVWSIWDRIPEQARPQARAVLKALVPTDSNSSNQVESTGLAQKRQRKKIS